ncbi:MAG TPA: mechanosensitive ion channel [Candidatus Saccharibacteria bacterium]|nr:mechanosensitive ion channel [Candidatus Saccharibacteria bacterium]HMT39811.1 mechanosensitive ion channel [Candidatus Saccharibacteria bacterium]
MFFGSDIIIALNELFTQLVNSLPILVSGIFLAVVGIVVIKILSRLLAKFIDYVRISLGLKEIILILAKAGLWVLLTVGILQILGLSNIALALSGFVAAFSIGISQGFTRMVGDLVAGIQLANDQDFRVGDKVEVGGSQRIKGYIVEMDTKKTRILDVNNKLHIIPNSVVDENEWTILERDEITLVHLNRSDIIKVVSHKLKKDKK